MHREPVFEIDESRAKALVTRGQARFIHGRGKRGGIVGVQLTVPLADLADDDFSTKASSLHDLSGTKFAFRTKISTPETNFYSFRHKKMTIEDSPNFALARILNPGWPHGMLADAVTSLTSDGSKLFHVRFAEKRGRNTSRSKRLIVGLAA